MLASIRLRKLRLPLSGLFLMAGLLGQALPAGLPGAPVDAAGDDIRQEPSSPAGAAASPEPLPLADRVGPEARPAEEKPLEGLAKGGGLGKRVVVVDVSGVIDLGLAPFIERQLRAGQGASAFILEINTPGGRVDAALKIRDALLQAKVKTVAYIHPRAISAGALIAYACDVIAISTGGTMGAATPITLSPEGGAQSVDEKMISYFRAEMAATARAKGRRGDLAEAMVDKDIVIEGITPAGKLLTLDTDNALALKVADQRADSLAELLEGLGLEGCQVERPRIGWAEMVARALTNPVVSGLLMSLGMLGILIELYTPGFGAPGIIGIACLLLFFFGHLLARLAGLEEIALLVVGLVLLVVEIFVAPGHIAPGVIGVVLIVAGLTLSLTSLPIAVSFETGLLRAALSRTIISLLAALMLFLLVIKLLPRTRFAHPIIETATLSARAVGPDPGAPASRLAPGDTGRALSSLRPSGRADFGGTSFDVIAEADFVDAGAELELVALDGGKIVVREKRP